MEFSETGTEATTIRDPLIGAKVLGYEIIRPIGVGGMGKVYEALERNIGRRAAVKVLLPEAAQQPDFVARLKGEARAANAARHRGIIDIFGFTEMPDGRHAIVMEYLEGIPLDEELFRLAAEGRRMSTLEVLHVLDELASVLSVAHAAGVIHRDLKPSNIFLLQSSDGTKLLKVLDFGIAKFDVKASLKTATNMVLGTPHYMAPEQAAAQPASPSMDLYAFGVIAFELFTGRLPFLHENVMSLLLAHQQEAPPAPSSVNPSLPKVVDVFVLKLLAKRPEERFESGAQIRSQLSTLRRLLGDGEALTTAPGLEVHPAQVGPSTPTRIIESTQALTDRAIRRSTAPVIGAVLGLLALIALAVVAMRDPAPTSSLPVAPAVAAIPASPPEPIAAPLPEPTPALLPTAPPRVAKPDPTPSVLPTPRPTTDRHSALQKRVRALQARLVRAEAGGASLSLEQQQLQSLQAALKGAPDLRKLDQIEVALQRLEKDAR